MTYLAYNRFLNLIRAFGQHCRLVDSHDDSNVHDEVADMIFGLIDVNLLSYVPFDEFPKDNCDVLD